MSASPTIASEQTPDEAEAPVKRSFPVLVITVVLAACSITYELLLAQTLSALAANTVRWYSLAIGFFLISMGFGAFIYTLIPKRVSRMRLLFWVECVLIVVGVSVVAAVHSGHILFGHLYLLGYFPSALLSFLLFPLIISVLIGILTGLELPILMDFAKEDTGREEEAENEVLAGDYFGSLVGSIAFPLVLLSYFQLFEIGLLVATLNLLVAAYIFYRYLWKGALAWVVQTVSLLILTGLLFQLILYREDIDRYFIEKYYYYMSSGGELQSLFEPIEDFPPITTVQSPYQRIDVVHDKIGSVDDDLIEVFSTKLEEHPDTLTNRILFLNGDFQTNTLHEEVYHEWFAHVPIIMRKKVPKRILVLGGGDGYLIRELLKYDEVEEIVHIDLDRALVELANKHPALLQMNGGAFKHPKVKTSFRDGYYYVRTTEEQFPAIYIDFPIPNDYNLAKLYSVEFFQFIRQRLTDDGYAVFDASGIGLVDPPDMYRTQQVIEGSDWPTYYNTVKAAGFPVITPYLSTLGFFDAETLKKAVYTDGLVETGFEGDAQIPVGMQYALRRQALQGVLNDYVLSLQQGFIMLAKDPDRFSQSYWDPGVPLHVLNALRFNESFMAEFPKQEEVDWSHVNSIMLPRFPTTGFWEPRIPW